MTKRPLTCDRCGSDTNAVYRLVIKGTELAICSRCECSLSAWWYQGVKEAWQASMAPLTL